MAQRIGQVWGMVITVCLSAVLVACIFNQPGVYMQKIPLPDDAVEAWALDWGKASCVFIDNHKINEEHKSNEEAKGGHSHGSLPPYHFFCSQ